MKDASWDDPDPRIGFDALADTFYESSFVEFKALSVSYFVHCDIIEIRERFITPMLFSEGEYDE